MGSSGPARRCSAYNPTMLRKTLVTVLLLLCSACGSEDATDAAGIVGSYVMGSAEEARRKATEPDVEDPDAPKTLGELVKRAEAGEEFRFSASVDMLLVLEEDGTFDYFGPLKMGDDEHLIRGRWTKERETIHLHLDEPRLSRETTVSLLVCPWQPGVVEYPLGRDPEHQVYYRLLDPRRGGDQSGGGSGSCRRCGRATRACGPSTASPSGGGCPLRARCRLRATLRNAEATRRPTEARSPLRALSGSSLPGSTGRASHPRRHGAGSLPPAAEGQAGAREREVSVTAST